ncbi:MAG: glycoside hydrolase family 13 protein [Firmicutes bacterium]|nr:glycoside hydrolase family 13 protein [Bacillota bacterium]
MDIEHNSREKFFRDPFGAVTCGTEVSLKLSVGGVGIPKAIRLVYKEDDGEEKRVDMPYVYELSGHSIYAVDVKMPEKAGLIWYYFELETEQGVVYYGNNQRNLGGIGEICFYRPNNSFQITVYNDYYKTPDWFKNAIAYQIFPDRFCNGNEDGSFLGDRDDIIKHEWNNMPYYKAEQFGGEYKCNDFYGGNLKGVIKKLPYLEELGITVIYLNPIFKAYTNHKYDTGNYEEIDPMFGDEETFKELCEKAKEHGIRIILDGVFNHTGSDSKYFNKYGNYGDGGAYQTKDSPYYEWYKFMDWPKIYESWWGMTSLPQVEERSESYRDYILSGKDAIVKRWIKAGASGWRLDVVDELPDFFVTELRKNVKEVDEDAVIIGEVWEDASNKSAYGERRKYFLGDELDSVMNYVMRDAIIDAILLKIDAVELDGRLMSIKENYPAPAYYSLLNILSSHDVERIITLMGNAPTRHEVDREYQAKFNLDGFAFEQALERTALAVGLQMMLPGVPCVYYGDEIGMQGYGDPFCRKTFPWDDITKCDPEGIVRKRYKKMITLRKSSDAFSTGEFKSVYKYGSVYGFLRYTDDESYLVVVNMGLDFKNIRVDVAKYGIKKLVCVSDDGKNETLTAQNGIYYIDMPKLWVKVFKKLPPDIAAESSAE